MLAPRWRKVLRDLTGNLTRTALVICSLAVGVFAVGLVFGSRAILEREMPASYAATNPADATLIVEPFDDELLETVRRVPDVAAADARHALTVRLLTGPDEYRDLYLFAISDFDARRVNLLLPAGGAWPPGEGEVLIERAALGLSGAQVGDLLEVEIPGSVEHTLRVTGLAYDQSLEPATFHNTVYGYISLDTLAHLGLPRAYNQLFITVTNDVQGREAIRSVADAVEDQIETSGRLVFEQSVPEPGKQPLRDETAAVGVLLLVLGLLCLALSGFLTFNTMAALLAQQTRQIGLMKAIGARSGAIVQLYLALAALYGLAAIALGVPLGIAGARGLALFVAGVVNTNLHDLSVTPAIVALQIGAGLLAPLLAAVGPVLQSVRVSVREALSDYGLAGDQFGAGRLDRAVEAVVRRLRAIPPPLLLGVRNTVRRKGRLALTLATLSLGSALFIAVASVYASTRLTIDELFRYWEYDVRVTFARPYRDELVLREALRVPGVIAAEPFSLVSARRVHPDDHEGEALLAFALAADTFAVRPSLVAGRWLLPEDREAVVISNRFLEEEPGVAVGDTLDLKIEGHERSLRVVGLVEILAPEGPIIYLSQPYVAELRGGAGRTDGLYLLTADHHRTAQVQVAQALDRQFRPLGIHTRSVVPIAYVRDGIEVIFASVVAVLLVLAVLVVGVGGLGLAGSLNLGVLERRREIGVMRAIGASHWAVAKIVLAEALAIAGTSWLIGAAMAWPLSWLLCDIVGRALLQLPMVSTYAAGGALLWLAGSLALAILASLWPVRQALRLTVREVLAYT